MLTFKKDANALKRDQEIFNTISFGNVQPSPEDDRDFVASACLAEETFPEEYEPIITDVLNQGSVGSCTAHALVCLLEKNEQLIYQYFHDFSRGYIYANRRDSDYQGEGLVIREALKQLNHVGAVLYEDFPYNKTYPEVRALLEENEAALAAKAAEYKIKDYFRCYTEADIKRCIMNRGAVIICVPVYSDFSRDLHTTKTNELSGYHAMAIVGWTADGKWIVQNSWSALWGYEGYLLMDADYPVTEYWGLTIATDSNKSFEKPSVFKAIVKYIIKIAAKILAFFRKKLSHNTLN